MTFEPSSLNFPRKRSFPFWDLSEEEPISQDDQQWLDNELLEQRLTFADEVYAHHETQRYG